MEKRKKHLLLVEAEFSKGLTYHEAQDALDNVLKGVDLDAQPAATWDDGLYIDKLCVTDAEDLFK